MNDKQQMRTQAERIFAAVEKIERAFDKDLSGIEFDLTRPQLKTLISISHNNCCSMSELGRRTGYPTSALTGIIDRMVRKRLVRRVRDNHDRRIVNVITTQNGHDLAREFRRKLLKRTIVVLEKMSDSEREKMISLVERIAAGFEIQNGPKVGVPKNPVDRKKL